VLRPGALFLVGDPKQAIYRFRGADIGVYAAARTNVEGPSGGAVVQVTANFRSRRSAATPTGIRQLAEIGPEVRPPVPLLAHRWLSRRSFLAWHAYDEGNRPYGLGISAPHTWQGTRGGRLHDDKTPALH
jgi:hypothetical protein